ncbi:MAG: hypothetical protein JKY37_25225 [Nannocystaceae bacterium]|nr:hypothetical protein [Nannocystaceae bacterium]
MLAVVASASCGGKTDRTAETNAPSSGISLGGIDDDGGSGDSTAETDDDGDDGITEKLDVPNDPAPPTDQCYAADLLFVIDNSGSMCDAQVGLAEVVPDLVDAMFDSLPLGTDLHVGIVTTSFSHGGSHAESGCAATEGAMSLSDAFITDELVNQNGYQGRLFEYDGQRYFSARTHTESARDELKTWFSGAIVDVGCSGGAFDFPVAAAGYALSPGNAETNVGFLRDAGAALAIFVLTNETDHSPGSIASYRDMILDAKSECGGAECVLTAGLLAPNCVPEYDPPIWQFLNAFGAEPTWADVRDATLYEGVVAQTLAEGLVETCEAIGPVG